MEYSSRNEVEEKYKIDMSLYVKDEKDFENKINAVKENIEKFNDLKKDYLIDAEHFYNVLTLYFETEKLLEDLYIYSSVSYDFDLSNGDSLNKVNIISNLWRESDAASTYIVTDLLKFDKENINKYIKEYPKLEEYKFWIENVLRSKEHILGENEEKMISILTKNYRSFSQIASTLSDSTLKYGNIIIDGKEIEITSGNYRNLISNKDRNIRKCVFEAVNSKLSQFRDIYALSLNSYLSYCNDIAKIKKYENVLDMDSFESNIPASVHDTVTKIALNTLNSFQNYLKLIKKILNLEELHTYDIFVPLSNYDKNYSIEEARELIIKSLSVLGDDYIEKLNKMFDERRIDYASYKNKTSSIYSTSSYNGGPIVCTNYKNKLEDVSTIIHELGHAVHFIYSIENNNYVNYQYDLFVAEVASLTNEILLNGYLVKNGNKEEKMAGLYNNINVFQNNFYDAILEGQLEDIIHEKIKNGESINADIFDDTIRDIRKEFYGNEVVLDDLFISRWASRMHYYSPFYLYKYSTGVAAAMYFAKNILDGNKEVLNKYKMFLRSGGSNYPYLELKEAGVDLADELVYNEAINYFDELVNEFNELIEVK